MDTFTLERCYSAAGVKATAKYGKEKMSVWRPEKEAMRRQDHDTSWYVNHNFLSGLQDGAETFLYFLSFFFFFQEQTHHLDSSPTALLKSCLHVSVSGAVRYIRSL